MSELKTFLVVIRRDYDERKIVDWFVSTEENKAKRIKEILDESNTTVDEVAYGHVYEIVSNNEIDFKEVEKATNNV